MGKIVPLIPYLDSYKGENERVERTPSTNYRKTAETLLAAAGLALVVSGRSDLLQTKKNTGVAKILAGRLAHHVGRKIGVKSLDPNPSAAILGETSAVLSAYTLAEQKIIPKTVTAATIAYSACAVTQDLRAYNLQIPINHENRYADESLRDVATLASCLLPETAIGEIGSLAAGYYAMSALSAVNEESIQTHRRPYQSTFPRCLN